MADELVFDPFNDVTEDLYFIPPIGCTCTQAHTRIHTHHLKYVSILILLNMNKVNNMENQSDCLWITSRSKNQSSTSAIIKSFYSYCSSLLFVLVFDWGLPHVQYRGNYWSSVYCFITGCYNRCWVSLKHPLCSRSWHSWGHGYTALKRKRNKRKRKHFLEVVVYLLSCLSVC